MRALTIWNPHALMLRANVSYEDREVAKLAGFKWDGTTKQWTRRMAIEDAAALPFPTTRLQG